MAGFEKRKCTGYLLRHGEATGNVCGGYYGRTDCPLTEMGHWQAASAGRRLQELRAAEPERELLMLTSPLRRAVDTAAAVCETAGLDGEFMVEPDFQEIDFGRWEKRRYEELAHEDPAACQRLCDDWQNFCYPQGESFRMFSERVIAAWQKWQLLAIEQQKDMLIVSHGGVLKVIRIFAEGRSLEDFWRIRIELGEVQELVLS